MPLIPAYLLKQYLKVLLLCVFSFISILLVSQLEEIAQFAAMGAKLSYLLLFTFYQIPYILPIAIPLSCLISSLILFQRLSNSHELTLMRSCGIPLRRIMMPIHVTAALFALLTLYTTSELATSSHRATRKMVHEISSVSPILLLQGAQAAGVHNVFVQMETTRQGQAAHNVIAALKNPHQEDLALCLAKKLEMNEKRLGAQDVCLIMSDQGRLMIENSREMSSSTDELAHLICKPGLRIAHDHLKMRFLILRLKSLIAHQDSPRQIAKAFSEIVRRFSVGLAAFTFTLLGSASGLSISRTRSKASLVLALALSACALICFCMGKAYGHVVWLASLFYLLPHALIVLLSLWTVGRINQGRSV